MHLFVTVPHEGYLRSEIDDFVTAATALLSANGGSLTYRKIEDRPTMACRNRQAAEFLASPCDTFLTLDADCLPTRDGQPDMDGLRRLLDAITRPEVDIVSGWTLMLRETHGDMIPNIAGPPEPEPGRPYMRSSDIVTPYLEEPLVEITGGGVGAHCLMVGRHVLAAMRAAGRLWFEDVHERDPESERFGGRIHGHDFAFCHLAADLGFRVWIENRVCWGHDKNIDLRWVHDLVRNLSWQIRTLRGRLEEAGLDAST